ncbi:10984_t:CDS:2 [Funneliformis geosporum]|uniref:10984_t:CDS:1 n=1 Tax=Funneliformis geosporum TaxID=1117311 RepID=A0A9W4STB0_9GLOM|nr:10984_t:CDS:2 [Funneliformis geosporum]
MVKIINLFTDLSQIPNKILIEEGVYSFTADQQKTFILVYTTTLLWDLLDLPNREILLMPDCYK